MPAYGEILALKRVGHSIPLVDITYLFDNSSVEAPFRPVAVYIEGELTERRPRFRSGLRTLRLGYEIKMLR